MYKHIEFMSQMDMQYLPENQNAIAISITGSTGNNIAVSEKFKDIIYLKFDNVENLHSRLKRFSQEDAIAIYNLVKRHENDAETIYVNCQMGQSRSAAVALFLAQYYGLEMKQDTSQHIHIVYQFLKRVFQREDKKTKEI